MALEQSEILEAQLLIRRDTHANWQTKDPVLATGELGIDTTYNRIKSGIGARWNQTPHVDGSYLFLDSQNPGEIFRFYLPARSVLYRLDFSGGAAWRVRHNSGPKTAVRDMATTQPIAPGVFEFENGGTGANLLTLVIIPADPAEAGKFDISALGVQGAPVTSMYEEKLVVNVEQPLHGMTAGHLVGHDGAGWVKATGETPVLGVVEYQDVRGFRVVLAGLAVLGAAAALTPGAAYYRQADGTMGTAANGGAIFHATAPDAGIFARGGGSAGGGGAAISRWSARPVKTGEVVVTTNGSWFKARQDHNSATEPTAGGTWWELLYDNGKTAQWHHWMGPGSAFALPAGLTGEPALVMVDGRGQTAGVDYTLSATHLTLAEALEEGQRLSVLYLSAATGGGSGLSVEGAKSPGLVPMVQADGLTVTWSSVSAGQTFEAGVNYNPAE